MIDLSAKLPLSEAARRLDRPVETVRAWSVRGLKARGAGLVKLRTFRVGGRVYTTPLWLDEFLNVLNPTAA